jgi:hypothetical protein
MAQMGMKMKVIWMTESRLHHVCIGFDSIYPRVMAFNEDNLPIPVLSFILIERCLFQSTEYIYVCGMLRVL